MDVAPSIRHIPTPSGYEGKNCTGALALIHLAGDIGTSSSVGTVSSRVKGAAHGSGPLLRPSGFEFTVMSQFSVIMPQAQHDHALNVLVGTSLVPYG